MVSEHAAFFSGVAYSVCVCVRVVTMHNYGDTGYRDNETSGGILQLVGMLPYSAVNVVAYTVYNTTFFSGCSLHFTVCGVSVCVCVTVCVYVVCVKCESPTATVPSSLPVPHCSSLSGTPAGTPCSTSPANSAELPALDPKEEARIQGVPECCIYLPMLEHVVTTLPLGFLHWSH